MEKFSAVEIKADNRISEDDKVFCLRQQAAFDKSGPALQKIADMMTAANEEQSSILDANEDYLSRYLVGDGFRCEASYVLDAMKGRNRTFISAVVNYFSRKYNVELDEREIEEHLIPTGPKEPNLPWGGYRNMSEDEIASYREELDTYKVEKEKFEQSLRVLPLRYERVVDEIFVQLGGFSFQEKAMNEFLSRTWNCCHSTYRDNAEEFEIKNDTLKLTGYWCRCKDDSWRSHDEWESTDSLKTLLNALAWYECGRMDEGNLWFPELFRYDTERNFFETYNMEKVKSVKLFKNGRVDIKFRSVAYVQEFVETCLRRKVA
jgi:hypothetical protein